MKLTSLKYYTYHIFQVLRGRHMIGHANYRSSFIQLNDLVFVWLFPEHSVIYFYEPNLFLPVTFLFSKKHLHHGCRHRKFREFVCLHSWLVLFSFTEIDCHVAYAEVYSLFAKKDF